MFASFVRFSAVEEVRIVGIEEVLASTVASFLAMKDCIMRSRPFVFVRAVVADGTVVRCRGGCRWWWLVRWYVQDVVVGVCVIEVRDGLVQVSVSELLSASGGEGVCWVGL